MVGSGLAGLWKAPTMRILNRTIQLCRATCSYCPVVQRWTKILEFLYCGCRTVINLTGEGRLENGGWGYGGVWLEWNLTLQVSLPFRKGSYQYCRGEGEAKLEPKYEHTVKLVSQYTSKPFKEVHLSVYLTVLLKRRL